MVMTLCLRGLAAFVVLVPGLVGAGHRPSPASRHAVPLALPADVPLRVMSYNIAYGHGNLERTAETIASAAPDLVALQEVDVHWSERSQLADQATLLAQRLRMEGRFARIYQLSAPDSGARTRCERPLRRAVAVVRRRSPVEILPSVFRAHRLLRGAGTGTSLFGDDLNHPRRGVWRRTAWRRPDPSRLRWTQCRQDSRR